MGLMQERDRQILRLAIPSIVSNITVPLLGLVDVAIVGHMGSAVYIGAISVGSMIFNVIYWVFGFLRMGTSGMTAQALGRRDLCGVGQMLVRSMAVGLAVALAIVVLQVPVCRMALAIVSPEPEIARLVEVYFGICVWGAPAVLLLYGLSGWFVGMQNTRLPMIISIAQNVVNIAVSLFLVYGLGMKVEGVACGTLIAQYAGAAMALGLLWNYYRKLRRHLKWDGVFGKKVMFKFFNVNSDIFFRTICLVAVNLFFLSAGARQGSVVLAVNTLLMQLYILFSYFLDGFAFAGEALCGKALGAHNNLVFRRVVARIFHWGWAMAILFTFAYLFGGQAFLGILTDDGQVLSASAEYLPWAIAVPLAGVAAFVWDGVFVGITATRGMLLSSFAATVMFFVLYVGWGHSMGNHALWMAFVAYLAVRGIMQTVIYSKCHKNW